ncbi:MAG TPA: hypothetical protein PK869_07835 [Candidatus Hydrogenedentes bacterium]|nr:hypothetical protein [Candidatus Hydrogenedentota bacterium]
MTKHLCSRHYPFSHRRRSLRWVWEFNRPSFSQFNAPIVLPTKIGLDDLDDLTDILQAAKDPYDPVSPSHGPTWADAEYIVTNKTPAAFPAGWSIGSFDTFLIRYQHFVSNIIPTASPYTRQQMRVHRHGYYIGVTFNTTPAGGGIIRAQGTFPNRCDITLNGRWGVDTNGGLGPDLVNYIETGPIPTITACRQCTNREDSANFDSADMTTVTNSVTTNGTVPTAVVDYMTAMRDTLVTELNAATIAAKWRIAAVLWGVATDVHNKSLLDSGFINPLTY